MSEPDDWLSIAEVSQLTGKRHATIQRAMQRGSLKGRLVGAGHRAVWVTTRHEVSAWLGRLLAR